MRIKTLIASTDCVYTDHISEYISEYHADMIEIYVCNCEAQLHELLVSKKINVLLTDDITVDAADIVHVELPILLYSDNMPVSGDRGETGGRVSEAHIVTGRIRKHMRISSVISEILEEYARVTGSRPIDVSSNITAVWSPCGGSGSTTVSLAYAASKVMQNTDVFYLNLEFFASTSVYFDEQGKSISSVFEMIEGNTGNTSVLISGIHGCENGIKYLCAPDNYDDINILTAENINELISGCASITSELVIDMPCVCNIRTEQVFERADKVLIVVDSSQTGRLKLLQFISQSNIFETIREKAVLIINRCAPDSSAAGNILPADTEVKTILNLPYIKSSDARYIYKTLAKCNFGI